MHDYELANAKCHESPTVQFSEGSSAWEITSELEGSLQGGGGMEGGPSWMGRIEMCAERDF